MQKASEFLHRKVEEWKFRKKPIFRLLTYTQPTKGIDTTVQKSLHFLAYELGNGFLKSRVGIEFMLLQSEMKPSKDSTYTDTEYGIVVRPLLQKTRQEFELALNQALELVNTPEAKQFMHHRSTDNRDLERLEFFKHALEATAAMIAR